MPMMKKQSEQAEWAYCFDPGVIAAGSMKQFTQDSAQLRPGINARGHFNGLTVVNNSDCDIAVDFDFMPDRRRIVMAHTSNTFGNMTPYQGFDVHNLSSTTATAAAEVYITVRYERDVLRERE